MLSMKIWLRLLGTISLTTVAASSVIACNDDKNQNDPQIKTFEETYSDPGVKAIDEVVKFNNWTYYKLRWTTNNNKKVMLLITNQFATTKDSIEAFIDSLQKITTFKKNQKDKDSVYIKKITFSYIKLDFVEINVDETLWVQNLIAIQ